MRYLQSKLPFEPGQIVENAWSDDTVETTRVAVEKFDKVIHLLSRPKKAQLTLVACGKRSYEGFRFRRRSSSSIKPTSVGPSFIREYLFSLFSISSKHPANYPTAQVPYLDLRT